MTKRESRRELRLIAELGESIGLFMGMRIREERLARKMTLKGLAVRAGLSTTTPKQRMWEIENNLVGYGIRIGTLYAIAIALGVEPSSLLPTVKEIKEIFGDDLESLIKASQDRRRD